MEKRKKRRKPSLGERIRYYFKRREFIKEEKAKKKFKKDVIKKHRKEHDEYVKRRIGEKRRSSKGKVSSSTTFGKIYNSWFIRKDYIKIINSTVIFIISYILIYCIYQFTVIFTASLWGLDSTLYYFDLAFNDFSPLWTRYNILIINLSGPVISLIAGMILIMFLFKLKQFAGLQKLLILWLSLHGFNHFFGAFVSGVITGEGFGYVANWLYMDASMKILSSLILIFILVLTGYYATRCFFETAYSRSRVQKKGYRTVFLTNQALLPWIFGSIIILIVKAPNNFNYPYETCMLLTMGFVIVPTFFNHKIRRWPEKRWFSKRNSVALYYLLLLILLLGAFRIGLANGLEF